ncbi:Crp/Fnr family transcriptional regulator [Brevibacillus humidisoli]|uniref:Crp/Fnr family transcriptional regulator n=1 Tax=Brevibacillus humidisoli TaxID=2895522 RepID=UPI001E3D796C|nr:Crp/Fnr family transcriptional regulator [Brevibacillus humidisoli]UFJ41760.1 Crp/Fnr family transcriptional regulator [Brevibacillus humidisoli]
MTKEGTTTFLQQVPIFRDLNRQEIERVEEITISRYASKKSVIFSEGSEKEAVFFIREGLVKTYKTDEDGHEHIVSFLKSGDMFPHTGFFNQDPYPATAETIVDTQLLAIPVRLFERLMLQTPPIAIKLMRVMGDKIRELQEKLQVLSGQDVKHRLLSFLLHLAEQHGEMKDNRITINLPMTHQEFANAVGTTRETINRLLNQLGKEDILKADRSRIVIIDLDALKQQRELK